GIELRRRRTHFKTERIEVRRKVAARAIGADHHQRAHAVPGRGLNVLRRGARQARGDLLFELGGERAPIAIEQRGGFGGLRPRDFWAVPGGTFDGGADSVGIVAHGVEEGAPGGIYRVGIGGIAGGHLFHERRIGAVEKARFEHGCIGEAAGVIRHGTLTFRKPGRTHGKYRARRQTAPLLKCVGEGLKGCVGAGLRVYSAAAKGSATASSLVRSKRLEALSISKPTSTPSPSKSRLTPSATSRVSAPGTSFSSM